jgi:GT2 family glycosyltransferase
VTTPTAHAVWLGSRTVLLAARLDDLGERAQASIGPQDRLVPLETRVRPYGTDGQAGSLLIGHLPADEGPGGQATQLNVRAGNRTITIDMPEIDGSAPALRTLLRNELAALPSEQREEILDFILASAASDLRGPGALAVARRLAHVRAALREQLPQYTIHEEDPHAVWVNDILAIDHESFWVKGWVHDEDGALASLTAVAPEGQRVNLLDGAHRHRRLDIEERYAGRSDLLNERHGLIKRLTLDAPSRLSKGWVVELRTSTGVVLEIDAPEVERDINTVRSHILGSMPAERPGEDELIRNHVHPAIARIQGRLEEAVEIDTVVEIGEGHPRSPELSVIVPLYKRIDFVEYQLAQFGRDRELADVDLVYVLDSPEVAEKLLDSAHALSELHEIPLRIVLMKRNAGFSGANNAAVSVANGSRLVLLNSDVIPDRPGWLGKMSAFYEATPGIGALGPKLLFEDDSLQHAGLYFYRDAGSRAWLNKHYFKGLHRSFPAANSPRAVPGVTAACMMVDRDLYERSGGLSHAYVQGGYEDSDLCLRLIELGRQNWYMPGAELYHLEGQSYPSKFRQLATDYNMWLHTHLWNDRIEEICREYGSPAERYEDAPAVEPVG